ncbi:MAG: hypothetical protein M3453_03885, partial [Pseudomonadota bacterium]|nr:hypothetical protein [Pseudomonadota bacterium]
MPARDHTGIAVVESRWWDIGNDSVRPLFEAFASIHCDNSHSFTYDMFNGKESFGRILARLGA